MKDDAREMKVGLLMSHSGVSRRLLLSRKKVSVTAEGSRCSRCRPTPGRLVRAPVGGAIDPTFRVRSVPPQVEHGSDGVDWLPVGAERELTGPFPSLQGD